MVDYHKQLKAALETILPSYYEMSLHSGIKTPCISYMELSNIDTVSGNTLGYSRIQYQVKVWGNNIELIQRYVAQIDKVLRPLGFKRVSSNELYNNSNSMMQKVMTYEAQAIESF